MATPWTWDGKRYHNAATGKFIGQKQMLVLRDQFIGGMKENMADLHGQLARGDITLRKWEKEMRAQIKLTYIDEYVLGHGGRGSMAKADWGRIGSMCKTQYEFLGGFADDIQGGRYTDDEGNLNADAIAGRSDMYVNSGSAPYERGLTLGQGLPDLPAYPGDGSTLCLSQCHCHWDIEETDEGWDATWVIGSDEPCESCLTHAAEWAPLHIPKE